MLRCDCAYQQSCAELNEAINQINRYRTYSFKGLFRYIQVFVVSNSVQTKYFANANERRFDGSEQLILKSLAFYWTDKNNVRINRLGEFTQDFFDKFSLNELLTRFMVIKETEPVLWLCDLIRFTLSKSDVTEFAKANGISPLGYRK